MRRLCLPLLFLSTPALAETDVRQAVIDVATASGCVITDAIAEASFPPLGLTQDMVGPVVEEMILADEGELIDNEFHLAPMPKSLTQVYTSADRWPDLPMCWKKFRTSSQRQYPLQSGHDWLCARDWIGPKPCRTPATI
jgi:hypothetical protein